MDSIPKFLASVITIIIAVLLCVSLIISAVVVNSARTYHSSVIEQIEASNFEEATIQKCITAAAADNYILAVEKTTTADSDPYSFYRVTLNYNLSAPLFGKLHAGEIVGYALAGVRVDRPATGGQSAQGAVPGLYETGSNYSKLLIPWDKLVEDGIVSLNNGVVGTGYTSGSNVSSDTLAGDLMFPFDGSVTDIEETGFFMCEKLTGVKIPDSVETIGKSAFAGCTDLAKVHLGARLETANSNAFNYDGKITEVYYNGSVEDWCNLSFGNMYSNPLLSGADLYCYGKRVEEVTISENVTSIKNKFTGCQSLTSVTIPDGTLTEVSASAFKRCSNLTSVKIGEGVTTIGGSAFTECYNLETVHIPASVTTIGSRPFYACESIQKIVVADGNTKYYDVDDACLIETATSTLLFGTAIDGVAVIPEGVVTLESYAFGYNSNIETVIIPASLTTMYYDVFEGCSNLAYVSVADGNTTFHSVDNCIIRTASKALVLGSKNSVIPTDGSVTTIGSSAFCGVSITSMVIPEGITSLGATVFCYCFDLKEVTLPVSLTSFSNNLFLYCESLTDIHYGGTMAQWNAISFPSTWDVGTGNYVIHCTDGDIAKASS